LYVPLEVRRKAAFEKVSPVAAEDFLNALASGLAKKD